MDDRRVLSRRLILALHASPLVRPPASMKDLKDWFGEYDPAQVTANQRFYDQNGQQRRAPASRQNGQTGQMGDFKLPPGSGIPTQRNGKERARNGAQEQRTPLATRKGDDRKEFTKKDGRADDNGWRAQRKQPEPQQKAPSWMDSTPDTPFALGTADQDAAIAEKLDSIQAWKAQFKKEQEVRDTKATSTLTAGMTQPEPVPKPSASSYILEPSNSSNQQAEPALPKSSRFAKRFADQKSSEPINIASSSVPAPSNPLLSILGGGPSSLPKSTPPASTSVGAATAGGESESMRRLMDMLQMSSPTPASSAPQQPPRDAANILNAMRGPPMTPQRSNPPQFNNAQSPPPPRDAYYPQQASRPPPFPTNPNPTPHFVDPSLIRYMNLSPPANNGPMPNNSAMPQQRHMQSPPLQQPGRFDHPSMHHPGYPPNMPFPQGPPPHFPHPAQSPPREMSPPHPQNHAQMDLMALLTANQQRSQQRPPGNAEYW